MDVIEVSFSDNSLLPVVYGERNNNIKYIEKQLGVMLAVAGSDVSIKGGIENMSKAKEVLEDIYDKARKGFDINSAEIDNSIRFLGGPEAELLESKTAKTNAADGDKIVIKTRKKTIVPRSKMQGEYLAELLANDLTISLGPAGTGKTYLAVAAAVHMYMANKVEKIVLCRPAVDAGEKLGFLPGDLKEKVDPYMQPLYDALNDMMPFESVNRCMEIGEIEVSPLAFMRGRTLSNAFIILDEAQNATKTQMKMFLTRLGMNSRMVITGDESQIDLPRPSDSGLTDAAERIGDIEGVGIVKLTNADVVRHPLTAKIVKAYES